MKAHELLADKEKWTFGTLGRDANGKACGTLPNSGAVKFDASGAISWCYRDKWQEPHKKARKLAWARHGMSLWQANDRLGYEEVLSILKDCDV